MAICQIEEVKEEGETWKLYFDGASNLSGQRIGLVTLARSKPESESDKAASTEQRTNPRTDEYARKRATSISQRA
ncbi:hypothetical protein CCACVL1_27340 [Corchorus capsularis]|uniref:Uncharacterized protein n=1 Tax=Corchorus capsularis TaxID=210143 RepID=A0A1R3GB07_COCAP|nr:hypothetical protein CCACVL1_27340 [Corchorus capsularis]